jgi:death on curing protein
VTDWRWIPAPVVLAIHDRQIAEHGGLGGVRDIKAVHSALARPRNLAAYGAPDAADLAAAYAFGLARNHAFSDGNKGSAWVVARLFLLDNGFALRFEWLDAIAAMEGLAGGMLSETDLAAWFRSRMDR